MSGDTEIKKLTTEETQREKMKRQVVVVGVVRVRRKDAGSGRGERGGSKPRRDGREGNRAGEREGKGKEQDRSGREKRGKRFGWGKTTVFTAAMAGSLVAPHT